jgi:flagellar motor switch protein FliN/FliY
MTVDDETPISDTPENEAEDRKVPESSQAFDRLLNELDEPKIPEKTSPSEDTQEPTGDQEQTEEQEETSKKPSPDELIGAEGQDLDETLIGTVSEPVSLPEGILNELSPEESKEDAVSAAVGEDEFRPVSSENSENLKKILRIKVPFKVVLSEKKVRMRDILTFQVGSLIEFDKLSDEHLDILVNQQFFGYGEVVKIHEKFGVRVKSILSLKEKIRRLGQI